MTGTTTERQLLPDVAAYVEALEAASCEFRQRLHEIDEMYPRRYALGTAEEQAARWAYNLQNHEYSRRRSEARNRAWRQLAASSDPLVAWVAENCEGYREEVRAALVLLPASLDDLDELAEKHGWCCAWDARVCGADNYDDYNDHDCLDFRGQLINEGFFSESRSAERYTGTV